MPSGFSRKPVDVGTLGGSSGALSSFARYVLRACFLVAWWERRPCGLLLLKLASWWRRFGDWQREGRVRVRVARVLEGVLGLGWLRGLCWTTTRLQSWSWSRSCCAVSELELFCKDIFYNFSPSAAPTSCPSCTLASNLSTTATKVSTSRTLFSDVSATATCMSNLSKTLLTSVRDVEKQLERRVTKLEQWCEDIAVRLIAAKDRVENLEHWG